MPARRNESLAPHDAWDAKFSRIQSMGRDQRPLHESTQQEKLEIVRRPRDTGLRTLEEILPCIFLGHGAASEGPLARQKK
jgi:hypothetical protein